MLQVISMKTCWEAWGFSYWVALHEKQHQEVERMESLDEMMVEVDVHMSLKLHNYLEKLLAQ